MSAEKYADIIGLPRHVSPTRTPMSMEARAAQFAPFAALTGYGDEIRETGRLTGRRIEPDEDRKAELDAALRILHDRTAGRPFARITFFLPDPLKEGGSYVTAEGRVKRIDPLERNVTMEDGTVIPIGDIIDLSGDGVPEC